MPPLGQCAWISASGPLPIDCKTEQLQLLNDVASKNCAIITKCRRYNSNQQWWYCTVCVLIFFGQKIGMHEVIGLGFSSFNPSIWKNFEKAKEKVVKD